MPTVRIWVLESDADEKVVECLANKLTIYLQLNNLCIKTAGQSTLASIRRRKHDKPLKVGIRNFLKEDDCVIFVLDLDSRKSTIVNIRNNGTILQKYVILLALWHIHQIYAHASYNS